MKNIWVVIGVIAIVVGLIGAFAIGAFAFAQRPFAPVAGAFNQGWNQMGPGMMGNGGAMGMGSGMMGRGGMMDSAGMMGQGGGMMGGRGGMMGGVVGGGFSAPQNSLIDIAAKDLNLTVTDLFTELQKGKSIADVAKEKNVSTDKIVEDYVAARTQTLKAAVDAKQITQAQSDAMLALTKANAAQALTRTHTVGSFGPGMMGQNWNGGQVLPGQTLPGGRGGMMGGRGGRR